MTKTDLGKILKSSPMRARLESHHVQLLLFQLRLLQLQLLQLQFLQLRL